MGSEMCIRDSSSIDSVGQPFFFQNRSISEPEEKYAFGSGLAPKSRTRAFFLAFVLDPQFPFQSETEQGARLICRCLRGSSTSVNHTQDADQQTQHTSTSQYLATVQQQRVPHAAANDLKVVGPVLGARIGAGSSVDMPHGEGKGVL